MRPFPINKKTVTMMAVMRTEGPKPRVGIIVLNRISDLWLQYTRNEFTVELRDGNEQA